MASSTSRLSRPARPKEQLDKSQRLLGDLVEARAREGEAKLQHAQRVEYLAYHDGLTGLPNRLLLEDRMKQSLAQAARHGQHAAVLCLDLDAAESVRRSLDVDRAALLAARLKAFSDPTRLLVAQALAERELCGCDLGWVTGHSDKVVSHHLRRLRREGLVTSRREGKVVFASLTELGRIMLECVETIAV